MCKHIIGILHNYEDTALFTFAELKEKSSENIRLSKNTQNFSKMTRYTQCQIIVTKESPPI